MNIDLGLDKFTETISNALGLTAIGIKKNAKAESYASIIKAKTDAEVALIKIQGEEKVAQYLLSRNKQKLENVESIISKAEKQFIPNEPVSDKPVDHDWMNRFLNIAEEISDEDMRNLWAQVLAGEVKKPQSYSLRTLEVLRNMTKSEADLVVKSSKFLLFLDSLSKDDFALEIKDEILLEDIGIVCGEEIVITYKIKKDEKLSLLLNPWHLINIYGPNGLTFKLKQKKLTKAGTEIMQLIQQQDDSMFISNLTKSLKKQGAYKVTVNDVFRKGSELFYNKNEIEI